MKQIEERLVETSELGTCRDNAENMHTSRHSNPILASSSHSKVGPNFKTGCTYEYVLSLHPQTTKVLFDARKDTIKKKLSTTFLQDYDANISKNNIFKHFCHFIVKCILLIIYFLLHLLTQDLLFVLQFFY